MCKHETITDTAIEHAEVMQPNGETITELVHIDIEKCSTCETVKQSMRDCVGAN